MQENHIIDGIDELGRLLTESGYFEGPGALVQAGARPPSIVPARALRDAFDTVRRTEKQLGNIAGFLHRRIVPLGRELLSKMRKPEEFDRFCSFLDALRMSIGDLKCEKEFAGLYGDVLSLYILSLSGSGAVGRESPIVSVILKNIARRKALELGPTGFAQAVAKVRHAITISLISKRYAVYVLVTRGLQVLLRGEIPFRTFGTSPEGLALQIANLLLKNGVKLSEVSDVVCGGGDLGTLPDGIYVLTEKVRDESWKRLHNSSLNRGALIAWELKELLRIQGDRGQMNASLCSPLSFSTLDSHDLSFFYTADSVQLNQSLKGFVKVTPLKSMAALLSELERVNQQSLNLLVMSLDELFASVVRKTGPRIIREMAAQQANRILIDFDFGKIVQALEHENFTIPSQFRLASREIGTGVKEVCELLMIIGSGRISPSLARNLTHVVDCYARKVDMVLEMASAGMPEERPHFIVITSMMAQDPHFQSLFGKIRPMIDDPFVPVLCLDSFELEYLTADHLFEIYVNPAQRDRRLNYSVETRSMRHALQVLGSARAGTEEFSFSALLDEITTSIGDGKLPAANLVVVGADNEDALVAVCNAREKGMINRVALIGDPDEILGAVERCKADLTPATDPRVEILPIDPLAVDADAKKISMAKVFHSFLKDNPDFIVMKGSLDTSMLLHEALAIYRTNESAGGEGRTGTSAKKMASHTALFVLPDGRFFALSDAAVNPGFRNSDALVTAMENQLDVVRKVVAADHPLKMAIITAVEKETSAIPATLLAGEAQTKAKTLEAKYGPLIVEGPLSFDLATVPEVAEEKQYQGEIKGDANCLMVTDINTANVLYKMLSKTMGSLGIVVDNGGIITAGPGTAPIVLTSRGDTAQTKLNSILLALAFLARK
jgi:phosphate butyryltransferase